MFKNDEPLYVKCPVCAGTKSTRFDFLLSGGGKLVAGSGCFACCDDHGEGEPLGFVESGMTMGQAEERRAWVDRLRLFVDDVARFDNGVLPDGTPVTDRDRGIVLVDFKSRAVELVFRHAGEIEDARRRVGNTTPKQESR